VQRLAQSDYRGPDGCARWIADVRTIVRQIQKFVEIPVGILDRIAATDVCGSWTGCGKGYLTFAAHEWLRQNGWPSAD